VFIRDLLDLGDKDDERGEGLKAIVQAFAERTNGFGGGSSSAAAERNTIGGAQQ
jgi:hypothetical protein